jgi:hypothetical protein
MSGAKNETRRPRIARAIRVSHLPPPRTNTMKIHIFAYCVVLPVAAAAFDQPPPFPNVRIESPSLSLVGDALQKAPDFVSDFQRHNQAVVPEAARVSRMPIVSPKGEADPKMIKAPDPTIDYKLTVKSPDVDPAR